MDEQQDGSLTNRVERLEATVRELQQTVEEIGGAWGPNAGPQASGDAPRTGPLAPVPLRAASAGVAETIRLPESERQQPPLGPSAHENVTLRVPPVDFDVVRSSEWWLNKIGIGLLLLGLGFLFKYAVDKGWLTEQVRIGFGLALGSVLLGLGLRLHKKYKPFSQVLLGGSIACYYITGYAAY